MPLIRLFDDKAREFSTNGIGPLPSVLECYVSEELNGPFELEMVYPVDGRHFSDIHCRSIIVCKPNPFTTPQAFRVYSISKPINGVTTINAAHISYDLNGITISPFSAKGLSNVLAKIKSGATTECPFEFTTDKTDTTTTLKTVTPFAIRSVLLGQEGSVLDVFGGEYEWDNFSVNLKDHRGADNGVVIAYGKNLLDIEQEENISEMYTGVHPYYYSESKGLREANPKIVNVEGNFDFTNIATLDLTSKWSSIPTAAQVKAEAQKYIKDNNIGTPKVSIDISFLQLAQSGEYEMLYALDSVLLGDSVTVHFGRLGIDATAKCVSYKYNVLTNRYDEITLGNTKSNLATAISGQNQTVRTNLFSTRSYLEQVISGGGEDPGGGGEEGGETDPGTE